MKNPRKMNKINFQFLSLSQERCDDFVHENFISCNIGQVKNDKIIIIQKKIEVRYEDKNFIMLINFMLINFMLINFMLI